MRACCDKKEDNFITYHSNREKTINHVREWEKLNPEKRKEYTIKYYKTEKGHRKRLAQQKRYREKKKLIKENEKLKKDKMELLLIIDNLENKNKKHKEVIDKAIISIDILIEIIKQQPTDNALDDLWILDKLNGFKDILKEVK